MKRDRHRRATGFCLSQNTFSLHCAIETVHRRQKSMNPHQVNNKYFSDNNSQPKSKKKTVYYRSVITNTCMRWRYKILLHTIFIVVECAEKAPKPDWINIYRKMKHSFRSQNATPVFFSLSLSLFRFFGCVFCISLSHVHDLYIKLFCRGICRCVRALIFSFATYAANMNPVVSPLRCVPWIPSKLKANPIPNEYLKKKKTIYVYATVCICFA